VKRKISRKEDIKKEEDDGFQGLACGGRRLELNPYLCYNFPNRNILEEEAVCGNPRH
jgi:hypothetical protein